MQVIPFAGGFYAIEDPVQTMRARNGGPLHRYVTKVNRRAGTALLDDGTSCALVEGCTRQGEHTMDFADALLAVAVDPRTKPPVGHFINLSMFARDGAS